MTDIKNAYIQTPTSEKHYIICREDFRIHKGKVTLIKRAIYGEKSTGRDYWLHLRSCMEFLGFKSFKSDPDVWIREAVKNDGTKYYAYVLLYVDDYISIGLNPGNILRDEIGKYFKLKKSSIGPPSQYLREKIRKVLLNNVIKFWAFGLLQYIQESVTNVRE